MTTQLDVLIAAALERRTLREREERERKERAFELLIDPSALAQLDFLEHRAQLIANFRERYTGAFLDQLRYALESAGARIVVPPHQDTACLVWPAGPAEIELEAGEEANWELHFLGNAVIAGSFWKLITPTYDYVRIGSEGETNLDDTLLCAMADWREQWRAKKAEAPEEPTEEVLADIPF